jgi:hypothetical protein
MAVAPQITVGVGGQNQVKLIATFGSGGQADLTSNSTWTSSAPHVATVSSGLVTGVSAGSASIDGYDPFEAIQAGYICYGENTQFTCPEGVQATSEGSIVPVITAIDPDVALVGSSNIPTVTINGSGFGTSPTVNLPQGVTVVSGQGSTDTQIILNNVAVSISAPIGPNSMTVKANGQLSNQGAFTLDGPFYMIVQNDIITTCSGCTTTVARQTTYQVTNFSGSPSGTVNIGEPPGSQVLSGWNCKQGQPSPDGQPCPYATNSIGVFTDQWSLLSDGFTPATGCGWNVDDHWLWCPTGNSIGHLKGYLHNNSVQINGSTMPPQSNRMPIGTIINP